MSTRGCAWCAAPFPVPANNPHRRFCSPRCRVADWHFRHDRPPGAAPGTRTAVEIAAPDAARADAVATADAVPAVNAVADPNAAGGNAGTARCPHCRRPVAVLTVLVPPAAAVVAVPVTHAGEEPGGGA